MADNGVKDEHHIIQNAAMCVIEGYDTRKAPDVQADGSSTLIGSEHYNLTYGKSQAISAEIYGIEKKICLHSAGKNLNLGNRDKKVLDNYVISYFVDKKGLSPKSETRTPRNRHHLED